jgi:phosphatidylserine/phosphatidylglycerophosphate/cardiolipin synthase-like enzyme
MDLASGWSQARTLGAGPRAKYVPAFNRGFVISQFVSRYLDENYKGLTRDAALAAFKKDLSKPIGQKAETRFRAFLGGPIRDTLLELIAGVARSDDHLYAALFELGDQELIDALKKLGGRAHVVLANGSVPKPKGETAEHARTGDENADARKQLHDAGVDVELGHRFIAPKPLGHNKFAVVASKAGKAKAVWTGSTNWTTTGLCTQLNNGLLVRVPAVADAYLQQWHDLRAAGSDHPTELTTKNTTPAQPTPGVTVQFTRARAKADLAALTALVRSARQGVLFLMFQPGGSGILKDLRDLATEKPKLLIRGVVSTLPKGPEDERTGTSTTLKVDLLSSPPGTKETKRTSATVDVVQPRGHRYTASGWAEETTREQFRSNIGFAIIHSKVLLVDPFTDHPTIVTGSHNFSISASADNDENYIIIRDEPTLAEAYAVNIESAWRHYAGRLPNPHARLAGNAYLQALLEDQRRQEGFWGL